MELASQILSDVTIFTKYAKYIPEKQRRENWTELVTRNKEMHIRKFPHLSDEIEEAYKFVYDKKILPSMRALQFSGKPIEINNTRLYNCCFLPINHPVAFNELMFLLLSGTGVGYSVQNHHIDQLPEIKKPTRTRRYLVGDSIEGWADAVKMLVKAYFNGTSLPSFDFRDIREKGAALLTAGGKAPGPEPLKDCLHNIQKVFDRKSDGEKLSSLEVHDICCYIADAVLAGGIRRSAMIALFDIDDEDMLTCKFGDWYETNPQRGRANNSAVILRHKIDKQTFLDLWKKIELSGSGEPGFFFSNDKEFGMNPCAEISLRANQFCNLTTINAGSLVDQDDFNARAKAAAFLGTLQASYTDFHYLRDIWKKVTEKEALIGVSMTGIASGVVMTLDQQAAAKIVKEENARVAKLIGINSAARTTTVKPEGSSSLVLGTSSGIHAWHNEYYIRRLRLGKNESIYHYFSLNHPELLEDEFFKPTQQAVLSVPQKAPEGAITRQESAIDLLTRVSHVWNNWVSTGHRKGANKNNVSTTVTIKPDEWEGVGEWMWTNRDSFTALSVLPFLEHNYIQAPYSDITEKEYNNLMKQLHQVNLDDVVELADNTDLAGEVACGGGSTSTTGGCEVT